MIEETQIEPKAVPASLFTQAESFGVGSSERGTVEIPFDLLLDESHTLEFDASDHPIENGAVITDHVVQKLRTCTVTGMFTNHPAADSDIAENEWRKYRNESEEDEDMTSPRARDLFHDLVELAMNRKPVRLVTTLFVYPEMIITSLPVKRTPDDGESVKFTITMREFKTVNLKKTAVFGKFRAPDMTTEENRLVSEKTTKGKAAARQKKLAKGVTDALRSR